MISRRRFLKTASHATAVATAACHPTVSRHTPITPQWAQVLDASLPDIALDEAQAAGASYADVRVTNSTLRRLYLTDRQSRGDDGLETVGRSSGFGVRVLIAGAWGFASDTRLTADAVRRAVREAVARASIEARQPGHLPVSLAATARASHVQRLSVHRDPAQVPRDEKLGHLLSINDTLLRHPGIVHAHTSLVFDREWRLVATSEGARIEEETARTYAHIMAHAQRGRRSGTRTFRSSPRVGGFEAFDRLALLAECERIAAEAVAKSAAASFRERVVDLIATPSHAVMPLHLGVALPTEIDRMGAANAAVAPFLQLSDLGSTRYGPPLLNIDGRANGFLYDDEGTERRAFPLVRDGVWVAPQTTRAAAFGAGLPASTGCARAVSFAYPPLLRSTGLSIESPSAHGSLADLIADTRTGVLLDGAGTWVPVGKGRVAWSADAAWEIKNGRVAGMVDEVGYVASPLELLQKLDAFGGLALTCLTPPDAKGSPAQILVHQHRLPAMRFRQVSAGR